MTKAAGLHQNMFGRGDLPAAFRRKHDRNDDGSRMTAREHAVLACRVAGLRKAASGGEVGGLGSREEMDRLFALGGDRLQAECRAIPAHLRKDGSFALEGACVKDADARVAAVVGLFQAWVFNAGANPASMFPLDGSMFIEEEEEKEKRKAELGRAQWL